MSAPIIEHEEIVRLIGQSILSAIPEGASPTEALTALQNAAVFLLDGIEPSYRAHEYTCSIMFFVSEAKRRGISVADLRRYCQQIATDDERGFFHDPDR
jgi:hypothetical protein